MLKVAEAFCNETNYTVWSDLSSNLGTLAVMLQYTDLKPQMDGFLTKLYSPVADRLGWEAREGESRWKICTMSSANISAVTRSAVTTPP